ncbi:hypothetical protein NDU88_002718 [Pleurodeles waltl]|uniref:Uncharacterized protein n=1 Tax=Pleurodeles waltl TaxID=8319 RepID=A0AAV7UA26_PLEWA|nr:hypothetical protein NDU88_002718 [Pleurodeles waltl]
MDSRGTAPVWRWQQVAGGGLQRGLPTARYCLLPAAKRPIGKAWTAEADRGLTGSDQSWWRLGVVPDSHRTLEGCSGYPGVLLLLPAGVPWVCRRLPAPKRMAE